ncbi:MAG: BspA family leucine-rich repeat surface protein [Paludibacteraceae bacterium]|nr:BspA family leucine-rich repeat surface protein [Paludibacteraceae bacterium]
MKKWFLLFLLSIIGIAGVQAANEIYAVVNGDQTEMTLYYDGNRASRKGVTDWSEYNNAKSSNTARVQRIVLDASMKDARPTSTASWFQFFSYLERIDHLDYLNTSEVTDMSYMFSGCSALRQVDVSGFQTGKVEKMSMMFFQAGVEQLDVMKWDVGSLTTCIMMFGGCTNLTAIYCENDWSQQATKMEGSMMMFLGCTSLKGSRGTVYQDAKNDIEYARPDRKSTPGYFSFQPQIYVKAAQDKQTERVTLTIYYDHHYSEGFSLDNSIRRLAHVIVLDESVKNWRPKDISKLFQDYPLLDEIVHLDYLNTRYVEDMSYLFDNCPKLQSVDVSHFDTRNVKVMKRMFSFCDFRKLDLTGFDISGVTDMSEMFNGSVNLTTIYSNLDWSTSKELTNSTSMFTRCESLMSGMTHYDASHIDASYARPNSTSTPGYFTAKDEIYGAVMDNTFYLYYDKKRAQKNSIPHWQEDIYPDVKAVVLTPSMQNARPTSTANWFSPFRNAKTISHLELLNTSEVTDMTAMFKYCSYLTSLDVSHFDMRKVKSTAHMFESCYMLHTIYCADDWSENTALTNSERMFYDNDKLWGGMGFHYKSNCTDVTYARMDTKENWGYFTRPPEIYGVASNDGKTVTLYYDSSRESRSGELDWKAAYDKWTITKVVIDQSMANAPLTSMNRMFEDLLKVQTIEGLQLLNTSEVTDMTRLFYGCQYLTEIDISAWDTRNVQSTERMFSDCSMLTKIDMSTFRIDALENCSMMFHGSGQLRKIYCMANFSESTKITDSSVMFLYCTLLQGSNGTKFSSADTDKTLARPDIPNQAGYFSEPPSVYGVTSEDGKTFTLYCDDEKTKRGGDESWAGKSHSGVLSIIIDGSVAKSRPTNMDYWFQNFGDATSIQGMEYLHTEEVTSMTALFGNCSSLKTIDVSGFKTSKVTDMSFLFAQCKELKWLDLSGWDVSKVTSMTMMFNGCAKLTTIYCGQNWSTMSFTSDYMFNGCSKLRGGLGAVCNGETYIDKTYARPDTKDQVGYFSEFGDPQLYGVLSVTGDTLTIRYDHWHLINDGQTDLQKFSTWYDYHIKVVVFEESVEDARPTSTSKWFMNYTSLGKIVNLQFLNTSEVTDMSYMFYGCKLLPELNLSTFNTEKVTNMEAMFAGCAALTDLNISTWQTPNVTNMQILFWGCTSLTKLNLTKLDIHNVQTMMGMFWYCLELTTIYAETDWSKSTALTTSDGMFTDCPKLTGGSGTTYDENHADVSYAHVDGGTANPGYFSSTYVPYFTVRFEDHDGTLLKEMQVAQGGKAVAPDDPYRDGYTFTGWDTDFSNVQSDLTVTAKYKKKIVYYTVTFVDWDDTVLKKEEVAEGEDATPPAAPERDGYEFDGWDGNYKNVQSNRTITAKYIKKEQGLEEPGQTCNSQEPTATKLLRDGRLYLLYNGIMYDVQGRLIIDN